MSDFSLFLKLGLQHITDIAAYDHMLFLLALTASYSLKRWKSVAVVITAFTIGHSISLALAAYQVVKFPAEIIEFLIPLSIFITAAYSLYSLKNIGTGNPKVHYPMALLFGIIHGMGFSNYLRSLLGKESSIWKPLLSFNLGIEIGQLLFVLILLGISHILVRGTALRFRQWASLLTIISLLLSVYLMYETKFW